MKKIIIFLLLACPIVLFAQDSDELRNKEYLVKSESAIEPGAPLEVLDDEYHYSLLADYNIQLKRSIKLKIYQNTKLNFEDMANYIFYLNKNFSQYKNLKATLFHMNETIKSVDFKDLSYKITGTSADNFSKIKFEKGDFLEISYSIDYPYIFSINKMWVQSNLPIQHLTISTYFPELVEYTIELPGYPKTEEKSKTATNDNFVINGYPQILKFTREIYSYSYLTSKKAYPFYRALKDYYPKAQLILLKLKRTKEQKTPENITNITGQNIISYFLNKPDFLQKLKEDISIQKDYEARLAYIKDDRNKAFKIFDLVRRNFKWNKKDTIAMPINKPLTRIWDERNANSTEINMILLKLLLKNGYDAYPVVISTRDNGKIDFNNCSPADFNRTIVKLQLGDKTYFLDATTKYGDAPLASYQTLGANGFVISLKDVNDQVEIKDNIDYNENVTLLGNLLGDSVMLTNVYVNSTGYAKALKVHAIKEDSLKSFVNKYFIKPYRPKQFKHFIVANEYIDSLPLAQEFDFQIPIQKNDNLYSINLAWFCPDDSLFKLNEMQTEIDFGYNQNYTFMGKFAFSSDHYEVFSLPSNINLLTSNGEFTFTRQLSHNFNSVTLKYSFSFTKAIFNGEDAIDLNDAITKIKSYMNQPIILKKKY